ncbi:MAG: hypothetical protein CMJ45_06835 [Planctomyces sp.]|nr:hypothetical protein [Planctomyces sp.]
MNRLGFLVGIAFGFVIAGAGLHEYDTIHDMLLLQDIHVYLILASGVGTAMPLLWLMQKRRVKTPLGGSIELYNAKVERKNVFGGMTFGTSWAVAGTCPAPAIAMATGGGFLAVFVIAGLGAGLWLRDAVTGGGGLRSLIQIFKKAPGQPDAISET